MNHMQNHTWPTHWSPDVGKDKSREEKEEGIIDAGIEVDFWIYDCQHKVKKYKEHKDCIIWSLVLKCESETLHSWVYCDLYLDERIWNKLDVKGNTWVQNRFLRLCTAVSLRKSKSDDRINIAWFQNPNCFKQKVGRVTLKVEEYLDGQGVRKFKNEVDWFREPTDYQEGINLKINNQIFNPPAPGPDAPLDGRGNRLADTPF